MIDMSETYTDLVSFAFQARAFAQAGAATVAILARRTALLQETKQVVESEFPDVKIPLHTVDITDPKQVQAAAAEIGEFDILVMNAGFLPGPASIADSTLEDWWKGWEVRAQQRLGGVRSRADLRAL